MVVQSKIQIDNKLLVMSQKHWGVTDQSPPYPHNRVVHSKLIIDVSPVGFILHRYDHSTHRYRFGEG